MDKKRAVLLDVSAITFRAYYANMHFRTKDEPTGAIYGFVNTLLSVLNKFSPDYVGAAFDVKRSSLKRNEIYKEYKAHREAVPEDLLNQIPRIEEVLDCFNINRYKVEGYEADDVLGTLAKKFSENNVEVFVVTGDKDLAQIIDKNISIALLGQGDGSDKFKILSTDEDVINHLGVPSDKIPDLFGLIGDSSDGIPGVRKIGPKKAIPMIEKYGNLENIYANINDLTQISGIGKTIINNMIEDREIAFLSRELATICNNLPIEFSLDNMTFKINKDTLFNLFKELEFKVFIKKLNLESTEEETSIKPRDFQLIDNYKNFKKFINDIKKESLLSVLYSECGIAISSQYCDYYLPFFTTDSHKLGENISLFDNTTPTKDNIDIQYFFDSYKGKIITYNLKKLLNHGFNITNCAMDTMIGYHLISSLTTEDVDLPIQNLTDIHLEEYSNKFGKEKSENIPAEEFGKFICLRSYGLIKSYDPLLNSLKEKDLLNILENTEMPLIEVLSAMEKKGIKIDPEYFSKYEVELENSLNELQGNIFKIADEEFNINSPKQLAEILFFKLNLPPVKKTKTGFSTNEEVLETLKNNGAEIANYILDYRKLAKLKNTYVDAIPKLRDENNRVHTTFNQIGTVTGRLSSSDPNLQNIPVKSDEGIKIRQGFIANEDCLLMGIDYSQIELRVLAQLSGDSNLRDAYKHNADLHSLTAKKIFDLDNDTEVSREQRTIAKTINFSIIYGKTAFGLSKELNITPKEASEYIEKYFNQYPRVKEFEKEIIESTEKKGYTETYFGRRRIIDGINSHNKNIKNQAQRMAVNSVIQGTAAEILKKVMIEVYRYIKDKEGISLLLQVHDELIFEVHKDKVDLYKNEIEKIMKNTVKFDDVPLEINTNTGINWAETK